MGRQPAVDLLQRHGVPLTADCRPQPAAQEKDAAVLLNPGERVKRRHEIRQGHRRLIGVVKAAQTGRHPLLIQRRVREPPRKQRPLVGGIRPRRLGHERLTLPFAGRIATRFGRQPRRRRRGRPRHQSGHDRPPRGRAKRQPRRRVPVQPAIQPLQRGRRARHADRRVELRLALAIAPRAIGGAAQQQRFGPRQQRLTRRVIAVAPDHGHQAPHQRAGDLFVAFGGQRTKHHLRIARRRQTRLTHQIPQRPPQHRPQEIVVHAADVLLEPLHAHRIGEHDRVAIVTVIREHEVGGRPPSRRRHDRGIAAHFDRQPHRRLVGVVQQHLHLERPGTTPR